MASVVGVQEVRSRAEMGVSPTESERLNTKATRRV